MKSNYYAIIMAGGIGSRFWPMSTADKPKQFLNLANKNSSLLKDTFKRVSKIVNLENIYVVTNGKYRGLIEKEIPIIEKNILCEPLRKNTTNCILYATFKIKQENPNAILFITPSDHFIGDEDIFCSDINKLLEYSTKEDGNLFTLGIKPKGPNTGYGYIEYEEDSLIYESVKKVKKFTEKPNKDRAIYFLDKGNYLWNSGIFIWSMNSFIKLAKENIPFEFDLFSSGEGIYGTDREQSFIEGIFRKVAALPIDKSLMEKVNSIYVMEANFDWNDLGSWSSLYDISKKDQGDNLVLGNADEVYLFNSKENIINNDKDKKLIINGVDNLIVINMNGVILISSKDREQEIGEIFKSISE